MKATRLLVWRARPSASSSAVKLLPAPAGPYRAILRAALRAVGLWKPVMDGLRWDAEYALGKRAGEPCGGLLLRAASEIAAFGLEEAGLVALGGQLAEDGAVEGGG